MSFLLPSLRYSSRFSAGTSDQSYNHVSSQHSIQMPTMLCLCPSTLHFYSFTSPLPRTYLVEVDNWLPEVVGLPVEIPHANLSKVTRVVLVQVRSVVVLSTSKTATTGMLAVLSYTTFTGGDMSAATR